MTRFSGTGVGAHLELPIPEHWPGDPFAFSPLLVENNTFGDKRGDNDDIDMYGESTPVPVIRHNVFLSGHEDKINPTRCSAIIYGNIVNGSDDHGIVLRDRASRWCSTIW